MSFQQGLSGLNAASKNLDVIGNNIANSGTYGAKSSRAEFQDVYAGALNGSGASPVGIGVSLATVAQQFTQGNISTTASPMDLAINGGGFFQVSDGVNPVQYSRNGQFKLDKNGFIVNNAQLKLLGYSADVKGLIQPGLAKPLQLPTSGIAPNPTTKATLELNLDSRSLITNPVGLATKNAADALVAQTAANAAVAANPNSANTQAAANATNKVATTAATLAAATASGVQIDLKDPSTYNNATSMTAYDAKGQEVAVTLYFQKSSPDPATGGANWNVYATANGVNVALDSAGAAIATDPAGNPTTPFTTVTFPSTGGSPTLPTGVINLDLPAGSNTLAVPGIKLDLLGATENGSSFAVTNLTQDGYAPGQLTGINIESTGIVTARYSNGHTMNAGQIELANFRNAQGLQPMGGNVWARTASSGEAVVGTPGNGNIGALQSGALEESNVDLTAELVNMVTAQRAYQASAQTIKTQDQVLQTIVNLR